MAVTSKEFLDAEKQRGKSQHELISLLATTLPSKASKPKISQWTGKERTLNKLEMVSPDRASNQSRLFKVPALQCHQGSPLKSPASPIRTKHIAGVLSVQQMGTIINNPWTTTDAGKSINKPVME